MNTDQTEIAVETIQQAGQACLISFQYSGEAMKQSCVLLASKIDRFPNLIDYMVDDMNCPIPRRVLQKCEAVGRGQLHVDLLDNGTPGAEALKALPYYVQEKALTAPVEVWDPTKQEIRLLKALELGKKQAKMVFSDVGIRSKDEQIKWLAEENLRENIKASVHIDEMFHVKKDELVIEPTDKRFTISKRVLLNILQKMG